MLGVGLALRRIPSVFLRNLDHVETVGFEPTRSFIKRLITSLSLEISKAVRPLPLRPHVLRLTYTPQGLYLRKERGKNMKTTMLFIKHLLKKIDC